MAAATSTTPSGWSPVKRVPVQVGMATDVIGGQSGGRASSL